MTIDPRVALQSLTAALEEHLAAASARRGEGDPTVEAAFFAVADAFEVYEDALYEAYSEVTPLQVFDDDEEDDDEVLDEDLESLEE
ncbi:hypothetical protein IG195_17425 [Arthrobacter sp. TES]|jgi:hypothetical protein|uniref:Dehydrogenase n=1 Tax=Paenarthrobacter ureafaciens TaxID=37931 RepID=A0AAX3EP17_PAEUR|nr:MULTISPECIES: hypothetical protein [Paenarthrobacter]AMB40610.1 dehydrogenase [Arthrobacter sp. ATCC 21022]AOY71376.1 hypothetical protein ARZXY2_1831 [Arthrobacter sp. ZXY-2]ERI39467.1 dehydrogenase [Arthrobacter sp. AK-YN10]NKR11703.1 hypothetical protein [Arthrobacter sp. M5]NKR15767.1 hypothetical protein [Arthrobacter sp. M6]OEH63446.1 hypothetical protein A5N17_08505 [Arthrobacter sp. D2]OEH65213.1 hypothetical protein A5N13_00515 [Arthrobacter sp. D4]QOI63241.1 hypothetical protei